jgi:CHAT domain-containing protein
MSGIADRLLKEALSGEASLSRPTPARLPGSVRPASPRLDVFIEMEIDPCEEPEDPDVLILQPGEVYRLTLLVRSRPEGLGRFACRLKGSEMLLSISAPECPELILESGKTTDDVPRLAAVELTQAQIEAGVDVDFRIEVPAGSLRRRGFIEVAWRERDARSYKVCQSRAVQVEGEFLPWSPQDAATWNVDPSATPPEHMAFLYVRAQELSGPLHLRGWSRMQKLEDHEVERPNLSLASFTRENRASENIVLRVRSFSSQRISELSGWLHTLLEYYPDLLLVIDDSTGAEIPWEMIRLRNGYLGAEAEVVRWAQIKEYELIKLELDEKVCSGHAVGFLDSFSATSGADEAEAFKELGATSLGSLGAIISTSLKEVSLVYLACHGAVAYPENEAQRYQALFTTTRPKHLRILDLDLERLERRSPRVPAVFVNACHSGRLLGEANSLFGLPAAFLRKVADGYIGTLGEVSDMQAKRIGARVLRAFRENTSGVRLSELLRQLRREAADALDPLRTDPEHWQPFLFTFMYVYYGNPFIRVSLLKGEAPDKEGQP